MLILERIRKCHHTKLEVGNNRKLQTLFKVVLDYIQHLCTQSPVSFKVINSLANFLFILCGDIKVEAFKTMKNKLKSVVKKCSLRLKLKGSKGGLPALPEIVFLQVISIIYPASDFSHPITSPALYLIAMILSRAHFNSTSDAFMGLFTLNVLLSYVKLSKRYIPEIIPFLSKCAYVAAETKEPLTKLSASVLNLKREEKDFLLVREQCTGEPTSMNLNDLVNTSKDNTLS